jgi:hypothetical protein
MLKSYPRPYYLLSEEMAQVKQIRKNFKILINRRDVPWIPQGVVIYKSESVLLDGKIFMMQEEVR